MRRIAVVFGEILRATLRDRAAVSTMIVAVVVYSFYYPMAYRHQVARHVPIAAVDLDHSASSRALIRKLSTVRAVELTVRETSLHGARRALELGEIHGIFLVPAGFERDTLRGTGGQVVLYGNGSDLSRSGVVLAGMSDGVNGFALDAALQQPAGTGAAALSTPVLVQRPLFNTREGYGSTIVPAVAVLIIQQTLMLGVALLAGTRRERMGRLHFPVPDLAGMFAAFGLIGLANLLYFIGFAFWFQDYPRGGNFPGLIVAAVLFIAAVVAFSSFVASFFRIREHAFQILLPLGLPLFFLANVSWPAQATPLALVWLAKLVPSTAGINAMVKLNQMGASLQEVAPELVQLALLAVLYTVLAAWRYRPRLGAPRMDVDDS